MKKQETDIYGCPITWHHKFEDLIEDWFAPLAVGFLLLFIGCLGAGCMSASPERQAHRAVATTITTADAAMDVWFAYVQREEDALKELQKTDPAAYMARRRALVLAEGKVATVCDTYVNALRALILGAAALGPGEAPNSAEVDRLKAEIITLVQTLIR